MFKKIEHKIAAAFIAVSSLIGVHYTQKPTIQTEQHWLLNSEHHPKTKPGKKHHREMQQANFALDSAVQSTPTINVVEMNGCTDQEQVMVKQATTRANMILSNDKFKNYILDEKNFTETNGMTNSQIYDLMSHNPINVTIEIYDGDWKENHVWRTMGYEDENYPDTVFINRYFISTITVMSSLETHEGEGHGQGFHHYNVKETSIPYKLNDYIESIAASMNLND